LQRQFLRENIARLQRLLTKRRGALSQRKLRAQLSSMQGQLALLETFLPDLADPSPPEPLASRHSPTMTMPRRAAVGDRVVLGGGEPMLVVDIDDDQLTVAWNRAGRIIEDVLDRAAIRRV
jgi:hypothetical protein